MLHAAWLGCLQVHLGYRPHDESIDVRALAFETQGFSGAQLGSLVNTAASLAGKAGRERIAQRDLEQVPAPLGCLSSKGRTS